MFTRKTGNVDGENTSDAYTVKVETYAEDVVHFVGEVFHNQPRYLSSAQRADLAATLALQLQWTSLEPKTRSHGRTERNRPRVRFVDEVAQYGPPDMLDVRPGGLAIWNRSTLRVYRMPGEEMILRDEAVPHTIPVEHHDFLTLRMHIKTKVSPRKIAAIRALSDSVMFDPLKSDVYARCHFDGANVATLYLCKRIVGGLAGSAARALYKGTVTDTMPVGTVHDNERYQMMKDALLKWQGYETPSMTSLFAPAQPALGGTFVGVRLHGVLVALVHYDAHKKPDRFILGPKFKSLLVDVHSAFCAYQMKTMQCGRGTPTSQSMWMME